MSLSFSVLASWQTIDMERIAGRTAFITGGANGIGLGIARAFARAGAQVALADVDATALGAAQAELAKETRVETFVLDVRDRDAFARAADETETRLGPVSLLFNNAGVALSVPAEQMTYEAWDYALGINLDGVVNGLQTFVPRMCARGGGGHVVNTASGAGLAAPGAGTAHGGSRSSACRRRCASSCRARGSASRCCVPARSRRRSCTTRCARSRRRHRAPRRRW
jgi:NADP-dependent 3-hydroxy acid dehydrogenase YdfG